MSEHEEALRRVLEAEAAAVEVRPDALDEIRGRIARRRSWLGALRPGRSARPAPGGPAGRSRPGPRSELASPAGRPRSPRPGRSTPWYLAVGAGMVTAVAGSAAAVVLVAGPGGQPTVGPTPAPPGGSAPVPTPAPSAPAEATASPGAGRTGAPAATVTLAVYHVGTDRLVREAGGPVERPRLYREFHRLRAGDGSPAARTRAAVSAMLTRPAGDPDYARVWPATARVRGVAVTGGAVTVDLSGARDAATTVLPAERARVAVQQLVWTATAASGLRDVRVLLDGRPAGVLWGHVPAGGVLRRAPMVDVVAPVWLISPQHGAVVGRRVEVHVAGFVFEATAQLRVRQGDRVVEERVLTLDEGAPAQGEVKVTVTLPPGDYVFEAYELSAVDGSVQHLDDHAVTVR